jgi:branched-chain amino acid transport system permease protein
VVGGAVVTDFVSKVPFYYMGLGLAVVTVLVTVWFQGSKLGYYLQAIREDQDAANSLGIPLTFYKNIALMISAFFTAWAGALYGLYVGFVDPQTAVGLDISVQIVLTAIIGGIGTIIGPVVGAALLVALSEALRSNVLTDLLVGSGLVDAGSGIGRFLRDNLSHAHMLIYGVLVALTILYMPDGVLGAIKASIRKRRSRAAAGGAR